MGQGDISVRRFNLADCPCGPGATPVAPGERSPQLPTDIKFLQLANGNKGPVTIVIVGGDVNAPITIPPIGGTGVPGYPGLPGGAPTAPTDPTEDTPTAPTTPGGTTEPPAGPVIPTDPGTAPATPPSSATPPTDPGTAPATPPSSATPPTDPGTAPAVPPAGPNPMSGPLSKDDEIKILLAIILLMAKRDAEKKAAAEGTPEAAGPGTLNTSAFSPGANPFSVNAESVIGTKTTGSLNDYFNQNRRSSDPTLASSAA